MENTLFLLRFYFNGGVKKGSSLISEERKVQILQRFRALSVAEQQQEYEEVKQLSAARRATMTENATRGGMLFGALAFAVAVGSALVVLRPSGIVQACGLQAISCFILSAVVAVTMISSKRKVMKRDRDRKPTALARLEDIETDKEATSEPTKLERAYLTVAEKLEHRELLLLLERRALRLACRLSILGLLMILVGAEVLAVSSIF